MRKLLARLRFWRRKPTYDEEVLAALPWAYFRLDAADEYRDSSGNGNDLTYRGSRD